jgi:C2 domain
MNFHRMFCAAAGAALTLAIGIDAASTAVSAQEITVRITRVKALDRIDANSEADFYAQVTIAGETFKSDPMQDNDDIRPNWVFAKKVAPGVHDVKVVLMDKDVAKDDAVDINRVGSKRDLDFRVNTERCMISGFTNPYRCGASIVRAGDETRRAEIAFTVDVK